MQCDTAKKGRRRSHPLDCKCQVHDDDDPDPLRRRAASFIILCDDAEISHARSSIVVDNHLTFTM